MTTLKPALISVYGTINPDTGDVAFTNQGLSIGFFRNGSLRALLQAIVNETEANILSNTVYYRPG